MIFGLLAVLVLQTTTEHASRPRLWGDLYAGMKKAEVKALQTTDKVTLADGCTASLEYTWKQGKLSVVQLNANLPDVACLELADKTLAQKYGVPSARNVRIETPDCGVGKIADLCRALGGDHAIRWETSLWLKDGVRVIFRRSATPAFTIYYEADPTVTEQAIEAL